MLCIMYFLTSHVTRTVTTMHNTGLINHTQARTKSNRMTIKHARNRKLVNNKNKKCTITTRTHTHEREKNSVTHTHMTRVFLQPHQNEALWVLEFYYAFYAFECMLKLVSYAYTHPISGVLRLRKPLILRLMLLVVGLAAFCCCCCNCCCCCCNANCSCCCVSNICWNFKLPLLVSFSSHGSTNSNCERL